MNESILGFVDHKGVIIMNNKGETILPSHLLIDHAYNDPSQWFLCECVYIEVIGGISSYTENGRTEKRTFLTEGKFKVDIPLFVDRFISFYNIKLVNGQWEKQGEQITEGMIKCYISFALSPFGFDTRKIKEAYELLSIRCESSSENSNLIITGYDDIKIRETNYLFFPWFPRGKLTAIQGDSGSSKSTFVYGVGALVTIGSDLLGVPCEDPGNVMFITNEDDASDILTAFQDAGGDARKLMRIKEREQIAGLDFSENGAAQLNKIIKDNNLRFLVIDPIQAFLRGDMNKANETRPQLARLMDIAAENDICIAFIQHMGKDSSKAALHRGVGSVDIVAATRSVIQIVTDPEDDLYKIAFTVKNNTAALQDVRQAIRYQVRDHPGSFDFEKKKRLHYHGHAEFIELLPEYDDKLFQKSKQKAENEEKTAIEYQADPLVLTVRELVKYNPDRIFIGTDELIQRITDHCGRCPYQAGTKSKANGLNNHIIEIREALMQKDAIQIDIQTGSIKPQHYKWKGDMIIPDQVRTKGVHITAIKNGHEGGQQTEL